MAWHHVPTEDLPASIALVTAAGGIVAMSLAVLLWWGPGPQPGAPSVTTTAVTPHTVQAPTGHVPQLVIGAEYGAQANANPESALANQDMGGLLQWLDAHPDYSVVVVPRR